MKKWCVNKYVFFLLFSVFVLLMGCTDSEQDGNVDDNNAENNENENNNGNEGGENGKNSDGEEEPEPVTLLMVTHWDDGQFEANFKSHLEDKYPHITLEHVQSRHDELEENVFAKNLKPDLMMTSVSDYLLEIDLLLDLNPLIEEHNFDLDRIDPSILDYLEEMSNDGELNGLPLIRPEYALVYNPEIFDLFGVQYPTDDMTWDEVIDLASEVTGERNGVSYRGLHSGGYHHMMRQLEGGLSVDPETHEPIIDENEEYKIHLERLEKIINIPGNGFDSAEEWKDTRGVDLLREEELAMAADRAYAGAYADKAAETGMDFDFVTYPSWGEGYPDYGPNEPGNGLVITTLTEHPDEAFRAVEYFLSDEYQSWQAGQGNLPALTSEEVRGNFMKDHEHYDLLEDKNLEAITNVEAAPMPIRSPYENEILEGTNFREGLINGEDINTIIRKMQDQAEGNAKNVLGKQ
ncbi:MAG TPA: ABC transporter substrate-binding protein [Candidatus Dormibacteraeota bacterium]|nr:ABC transporter substrate-binding protein [Candidatus Dormibacteraeota bacterium]